MHLDSYIFITALSASSYGAIGLEKFFRKDHSIAMVLLLLMACLAASESYLCNSHLYAVANIIKLSSAALQFAILAYAKHRGFITRGLSIILFIIILPTAFASWLPTTVLNIHTIACLISFIYLASQLQHPQQEHVSESRSCMEDHNSEIEAWDPELEKLCREKVEYWVAHKGFIRNDSRDETAKELGLEPSDLKWYFAECMKEDFRSYRVNLRIEMAKEILSSNPEAPLNELGKELGFSTVSNFYTYFLKATGERPKEYISRVHGLE